MDGRKGGGEGGEEGGVVETNVDGVEVEIEGRLVVKEEGGVEMDRVTEFLAPLRIRYLLLWCLSFCC